MTALYKYTKLEYLESILDYGIYAAPVSNFNDPYEYQGIKNIDDFRVCCLSRNANAKLMWSHYADGHKGCSIQVALPDNWGEPGCELKNVSYSSSSENRSDWTREDAKQGLYTKDKKRKWENREKL